MEKYLLLLALVASCWGLIYYMMIANCHVIFLSYQQDVRDVEYAFMIRRIRENNKTYTLIGIDEISVRINKEDFDLHEVAVGKIWVYDGENHYCIDPGQFTLNFN